MIARNSKLNIKTLKRKDNLPEPKGDWGMPEEKLELSPLDTYNIGMSRGLIYNGEPYYSGEKEVSLTTSISEAFKETLTAQTKNAVSMGDYKDKGSAPTDQVGVQAKPAEKSAKGE